MMTQDDAELLASAADELLEAQAAGVTVLGDSVRGAELVWRARHQTAPVPVRVAQVHRAALQLERDLAALRVKVAA